MSKEEKRIDITKPLWDQSTFFGRVRHFAFVTDPTTIFVTDAQLDKAKVLYEQYRDGKEPSGTSLKDVIYAKKLYESSFHPDTGERQNVFGRMSFQVPGGMILTGAMLQFYRTSAAVIFWQWVNQSFNALVNYTNRNAKSPVTTTQLVAAYISATASALVTALGCKKYLAKRASPLLQRYVPFAAVAAANCVNIPLMRQGEILNGIAVTDENGKKVTESKIAAVKGISQVVSSRIFMAFPGMTIMPLIVERIQHKPWFANNPKLHAPFQVLAVGGFLIFMVPIACGLYPQLCSISPETLKRFEPEAYEKLQKNSSKIPEKLYFNKGL
ncbi:UNVERIFIED_CONTAM: hypothetical protein PYX00_007401 [Menopon gallinae]|uniref:Sidoreflexin n=1 Tax=Menopon gallinae TaxID=328185 RepID=A0AAW2HJQ5_9NEOP